MANLGELIVSIEAKTDSFDRSVNQTKKKTQGLEGTFKTATGNISKLIGGIAVGALVVKLGEIATEVVNVASEAEEVQGKFNTAFRGIEQTAEEVAKTLADNYGLAQSESKKLLGDTGDLLKGFGASATEALGFSEEIQQLSVDLASYNNVQGGAARVSKILTKSVLGNKDGLSELGVSLLDVDIKQELVRTGQDKLTGQAGKLAKAQATFNLILQQTGDAQGDYARTSESLANKTREAQAAVKDLKTELGRALLPTATSVTSIFGELTGKLADYIRKVNDLRTAEQAQALGIATKQQDLLLVKEKIEVEQKVLDELKKQAEFDKEEFGKVLDRTAQDIEIQNRKIAFQSRLAGELEKQIDKEEDLKQKQQEKADQENKNAQEREKQQEKADQNYKKQIENIDGILEQGKTELELIDEKIKELENLETKDSESNQKRLDALKLLNQERKAIIDEDVNAEKKAQQEKIDAALEAADKSLEIVEERDAEIDKARSEDLRKVEESQQKQVQYYQDAANSIIEIASNISSEKVRILEDELDEELEIIKETEKEDIKANENKLETALSTIKKELEANETLTDELEEENKQRIQDKKDANDEELADALRLIEETLSLKTDALKAESDGEVALKEFKQKLAEEELAQDIADTEAEIERLLATGEIEDEERARRLQAELENDAQLRELEEVAEAERLARIEAIRTAEQEAETARITAAEEAKAKQDDLNAELLQATTDFENERVTLAQDAEASRIKAQEDAQSESDRIEQERADEEKRIKEDLASQIFEIELAQYRAEKALAIIQAGVNTALALTQPQVLANPIAFTAVGVAGAAQLAAIASQPEPPKPAFAQGGVAIGRTNAIVGEDQGEVMFGMGVKGAPMFQEFIDRTVAGLKNGGQTIVNINSLYPPRRQDLERLARDLYNPQIKEQQRRGVNG